jgi:hypothetical protein
VSLNVPNGRLGQVKVTLHITSGTVTYLDEETAELTQYPFENASISFISDLDKHPVDLEILAQIDPDAHQTAREVIEQSGLPDAVFSIEYLFMKFTEVDLLLADNKDISLPDDMPGAARDKALSSLNFLLQGELGNFMLGAVVRRNNKQAVPTFAMTDFIFDVHANADMPEASTLAYLGMLSNRALPDDINLARTKLEYAWVRPEQLDGTKSTVAGIMAVRKGVFMDNYLIPLFTHEIGKIPTFHARQWPIPTNITLDSIPDDEWSWTYADSARQDDSSNDFFNHYEWHIGTHYDLTIAIVPGTNTLNISGGVSSFANVDFYSHGGELSAHTGSITMAGHQNVSGSVTMVDAGIGTGFSVQPTLTHTFGDLVVDSDDIWGVAKASQFFEKLGEDMHLAGDTTAERLQNQQRDMVDHLRVSLDTWLNNVTLDLGQHAFIPPGGGVFTFQNPRFSNAGDLIFDVIYQAP